MQLDLSELVVREGMRTVMDIDLPPVQDPDWEFIQPIRGTLTFTNGGEVIGIHGPLRTELRAPCDRCLAEVPSALEFTLDEDFAIEDVLHPGRRPTPDQDFDAVVGTVVYLDQGRPILDLDELVRQWAISELPTRMLCREECAGLCDRCGQNLNEARCGCAESSPDSPFAVLAGLLQDA